MPQDYVQDRSGRKLRIDYESDPYELKVIVWDDSQDEPVGWIDVDIWKQRGRAQVSLSRMRSSERGKGIGTVVYPKVHEYVRQKYHLPLTSDDDGQRSDAAEGLWGKLARLGKAKRAEGRWVMERIIMKNPWNMLESLLREEEDDSEDMLSRIGSVKAPKPYKPDDGEKPDARKDMIKQRAQATQGGKVQLYKEKQPLPKIVGDVLTKAGEKGATFGDVLKGIDAQMYPGEPHNQQRVKRVVMNFAKGGLDLKKLLDQMGDKVGDGKWKAKTGQKTESSGRSAWYSLLEANFDQSKFDNDPHKGVKMTGKTDDTWTKIDKATGKPIDQQPAGADGFSLDDSEIRILKAWAQKFSGHTGTYPSALKFAKTAKAGAQTVKGQDAYNIASDLLDIGTDPVIEKIGQKFLDAANEDNT